MAKDTHRTVTTDLGELELPEQVTVAVAELASAAHEGLLALAVGTGLQVLQVMLAADVARLVGPKGRHNPDRSAVRHGTQPGKVTLGGRRIPVDRPRVRRADGAAELPLATWQAFASTELLDQLALERMLAKLSTRRYHHGLEPVGSQVEHTATGTSRSAVSRRFVAATEHALAELLAQDLSGLDLVALLVDGIRVAEHTCVVALSIAIDGTKVPLALAETLTIGRLDVPPTLARTLRSTNSIESMIAICRDHAANHKRWRDGQMVLRWVAAGMGEAAKQFRRINGYLHLPALRAALDATIAVTPTKEDAA
jgi:hypothetical protein